MLLEKWVKEKEKCKDISLALLIRASIQSVFNNMGIFIKRSRDKVKGFQSQSN